MKSVCLIDDDLIYLMLIKRVISLNNLCNIVFEYTDGFEAFEELKKVHEKGEALPDVILLDINMPIWDGWDFLDSFGKLELVTVPEIYIVTSSSHSLDRAKATSYSIVKQMLTKPLDYEDLKSILNKNDEA